VNKDFSRSKVKVKMNSSRISEGGIRRVGKVVWCYEKAVYCFQFCTAGIEI